jgi:hypothetical protein
MKPAALFFVYEELDDDSAQRKSDEDRSQD